MARVVLLVGRGSLVSLGQVKGMAQRRIFVRVGQKSHHQIIGGLALNGVNYTEEGVQLINNIFDTFSAKKQDGKDA